MSQIYRFFCHETPFVLEAYNGAFADGRWTMEHGPVSGEPIEADVEAIWAKITEILKEESSNEKTLLRYGMQRPDLVWEELCRRSLAIEAAGGIVYMEQRMLWMKRHGRWDLPKGKAEAGELPDQTAVRECEEECGLKGLRLINPDQCYRTHHWYLYKGYPAMKTTIWYEMIAPRDLNQGLKPQVEEGITSLEWIDYQRMYREILPSTYPALRCMVEEIYGPSEGRNAEMPRATTAGTSGAGFPP
jgi:8-oxo-dGTP pyrophosphatase MutT (NUDIX family)